MAPVKGANQRTLAVATAGVGAASLVVAAVFGGLSIASHNDAKQWCSSATNVCTSPTGVDDRAAAISQGNTSTALFVTGAVLASAGVVLWLTAPSPKPAARVAFRIATMNKGGAGIAAYGSFE